MSGKKNKKRNKKQKKKQKKRECWNLESDDNDTKNEAGCCLFFSYTDGGSPFGYVDDDD